MQNLAPPCFHCKREVVKTEGVYSGAFFIEPGGNKVHEECWPEFKRMTAAKCLQCKQPVLDAEYFELEEGNVHNGCWKEYCLENYERCAYDKCKQPLCEWKCEPSDFSSGEFPLSEWKSGKGNFSGEINDVAGVSVHEECLKLYMDQLYITENIVKPDWEKVAVPTCVHCGELVMKVEDRFSGRSNEIKENVHVHEECWAAYYLEHYCFQCTEYLEFVEGKFSGKHHITEHGKVHNECWELYCRTHIPPCVHCREPCCEYGKYSGMIFKFEDKQECHAECFGPYAKSFVPESNSTILVYEEDISRKFGDIVLKSREGLCPICSSVRNGGDSDAAEQMKKDAEAIKTQAKQSVEKAEQEKTNLKAQLANVEQKLAEAMEEKASILQKLQEVQDANARCDAELKEARDAKEPLEKEREKLMRDIYTERTRVEEQWAEMQKVMESKQNCPVCGGGQQKPASEVADVHGGNNCRHCTVPVTIISDQFEGTYFTSQDETGTFKVHTECWEEFTRNLAGNNSTSIKEPGQLLARVLSFEDALHSDGSKTNDFVITVTTPTGAQFTLRRRYSEFQALFQMVKEKYNFQSIKEFSFPDQRGFFSFESPQQTANRRMQAFDDLCQRLVALQPLPVIVEDFLRQEMKA